MNLNQNVVERAQAPQTGQIFLRDDRVKGLGVRVTAGSKSFIFEWFARGHSHRLTIGNHPVMTVLAARHAAIRLRGEISQGRNPARERQQERAELTLQALIDRYIQDYAKAHRRSWQRDERRAEVHFAKLANRKLSDISTDDMVKLHGSIATQRGQVEANRALQLIRAIFNTAIEWKVFTGDNPVGTRFKFFREAQRERFLSPEELQRVNAALLKESDPAWRAYFPMLLMLGLRRNELLLVRWSDIDLDQRTLRLAQTKSGKSHLLPLPAAVADILMALPSRGRSEWLFPGTGATGHITEPKKAWERIRKRAGVSDVHIHDLRRTLGSWLAGAGFSLPVISKALNHSRSSSTEIYARLQLGVVREALEANSQSMFGPGK